MTCRCSPTRLSARLVEDRDGVVLAVPDTINPSSPMFRHAVRACGFS